MSFRGFLALSLLASTSAAFETEEVFLDGSPSDGPPVSVVYEMERPGDEVRLCFRFRFGLYEITEGGGVRPAVAGIRLEYNDAELSPALNENGFLPAEFQPDWNPSWGDRPYEDLPAEKGEWFTMGESVAPAELKLVYRFECRGRYRIRITGLLGDSVRARRIPTLVAIEEGAPVEVAEEEPVEVTEERPELAEELVVEDIGRYEELAAAGPGACPFCARTLLPGICSPGRPILFSCRYCPGAVHHHPDGRRRCSNLRNGRREHYDLVDGCPQGWKPGRRRLPERRQARSADRTPSRVLRRRRDGSPAVRGERPRERAAERPSTRGRSVHRPTSRPGSHGRRERAAAQQRRAPRVLRAGQRIARPPAPVRVTPASVRRVRNSPPRVARAGGRR
ncbi:MAG: hypothetical protein ACYSUN_08000 [Planctomycetota bacterium]